MNITWITRSFLDYRVPVYNELNRLVGDRLTVIYYGDVVPERVRREVENALGPNAIALNGEIRFSGRKSYRDGTANAGLRDRAIPRVDQGCAINVWNIAAGWWKKYYEGRMGGEIVS